MKKILLNSIAEVQAGYHSRSQIISAPTGTHLLVQGKNILYATRYKIEFTSLTRFTPERKTGPYLLQNGDVLVQAKGNIHYAFCFEIPVENVLAADTFYIVRTDKKIVNSSFLAWWINQAPAQSYLHQNSGGTGISFISKSVLERLPLPVPRMEIQIKIVQVEQLWQHSRELQNNLDNKRNELVQAVCLSSINKEPAHE
jgi:hypothetical protein